MSTYIVSLLQKTSNDKNMSEKKPELSDAMKRKLESKKFSKNPILGTKFTIAISSAKGGVGKSSFATKTWRTRRYRRSCIFLMLRGSWLDNWGDFNY